jgi:singapore isolate B (sub-type 7) whole genome shotgun sequence assembly, scaffold_3
VIRRVEGRWSFVFQVCELRQQQQLLESHVSVYCVQKTLSDTSGVPYQMTHMELAVGT